MSIAIANQSAFPCTKPQRTILGRKVANDDVVHRSYVVFGIPFLHFHRLWVDLYDTAGIQSQPIVAIFILGNGIDIAQLLAFEVRHGIGTHRYAVLVRCHPHASQLVLVEMLGGDVGQGGFVTLHIGKLSPLLILEVE